MFAMDGVSTVLNSVTIPSSVITIGEWGVVVVVVVSDELLLLLMMIIIL